MKGLKSLNYDFTSVYAFSLYAFSFCLPLYQKTSTLLIGVILILTVYKIFRFGERKSNKNKNLLLPVILYSAITASLLYSDEFNFRYIEQRASLFVMPLIFTNINLKNEVYLKILKAFVFGCVLAVLLCYINAFYVSFKIIDGEIIFQPVVNTEFSFFYSVVRDGNYFFSSFFSILHDSTYFAIYLNTSIAIILYLQLWEKSKLYYGVWVVFLLVIFQLSSKVGIVTCFLIHFIFILQKIKNKSLGLILIGVLVILGILFFSYNPRGKVLVEKFSKEGFSINPDERFGYTLRLMSWDASLELISENPILGVGVEDVQEELNDKYKRKGYNEALKESLNSHNQFFQIYLECGILGLLIILGMLYNMLAKTHFTGQYNIFNIMFLCILLLGFMFESVINRYSGISYFTFFYCLIISQNLNFKNKDQIT